MTAVGFIVDTEDILNELWTNYQYDGAAVFKLSQRSTLPPAVSSKEIL
jgi:hypothetical protein